MADPCRDVVLALIEAKLKAISQIANLTVERGRADPLDSDELPFLAIYDGGDNPQNDFTGERGYALRVDIEGRCAGDSDKEAEQAAGLLRAYVQQALLTDVTLGQHPGPR